MAQHAIPAAAILSVTAQPNSGEPPLDVILFYQLQNTGSLPLMNPVITGGCGPIPFVGGDINDNQVLDPGETWQAVSVCTIHETTTFNAFASATVCVDPGCLQTIAMITGDPSCAAGETLICDAGLRASTTVTVLLGCNCNESAIVPYSLKGSGDKELEGIEVTSARTDDPGAVTVKVTIQWNMFITCSEGSGGCVAKFKLEKTAAWAVDDKPAKVLNETFTGDAADPGVLTASGRCGGTTYLTDSETVYTATIKKANGAKINKTVKGELKITMTGAKVCPKETDWTLRLRLDASPGGPPGYDEPASDFDGDGFSNQQEEKRKPPTDPLDPNSKPAR